jgi:hypothetical protein
VSGFVASGGVLHMVSLPEEGQGGHREWSGEVVLLGHSFLINLSSYKSIHIYI